MDQDRELRKTGWRLMRAEMWRYRAWVALGIFMGLVWTVARVSVPLLAAAAIDRGILQSDTATTLRWAGAMLVVGAVQASSSAVRRYSAFRVANRVETDLRDRLFAHLQRLHFSFHDQAQTGQLMARANTDLTQIHTIVILVPLTIASSMTLLAVIGIMASTSVVLTLLALGSLPFLNFAATRFTKVMNPLGLEMQRELAELSGVVEESVSGVRVIKGFGAESLQKHRFEVEANDVFDRAMAMVRARSAFMPLVEFLPTLALVAILWYGGYQVIEGNLQLGTLVAFNAYVFMLIWPLRMVGMILGQAARASASGGRVHEVLTTPPEITDPPRPATLPEGPGEVRFESVRFGYPGGARVLDDFSLTVRAGEAVALVGATGSGKSTVARLIPRFYDVTSGRVSIDGVDVRDLAVRDLRRSVGLVFEDTFLFSETVRANIAFAEADATDEEIRGAAVLAGADAFVRNLPAGYDTVIGEHGYSLSGGQRQRVAIARAVLTNPRVLILDDATSAVDPTKEHEIRSALAEVMEGRTTIIIAHRPATIALADRVVLIDGGRVAAEGTHEELLASSERYRTVLARAGGLTETAT